MDKDKQKFWALMGIMCSILAMAAISILVSAVDKNGQTTDPTVLQAKLAILNMAMGGLIGGFGAASQAFFRHSKTDEDTASAVKDMAAALPPQVSTEPQPVVIEQPASQPVPITDETLTPQKAPWEKENA